jgi:hypothetical protein
MTLIGFMPFKVSFLEGVGTAMGTGMATKPRHRLLRFRLPAVTAAATAMETLAVTAMVMETLAVTAMVTVKIRAMTRIMGTERQG